MKHFVSIIQNGETPAMFAYDDKNAAMAAFHTEMAYRHPSRTSTVAFVFNANGTVVAHDSYIAPAPVDTPEVTEDGE